MLLLALFQILHQPPLPPPSDFTKRAHTYSIVAYDSTTGDLGIAVQSKFPNVGGLVPWARAGVGAVATQALSNTDYGEKGLELLARGGTGPGDHSEPPARPAAAAPAPRAPPPHP